MVTDKQLAMIMPNCSPSKRASYLPFINKAMEEFEINTPLRQAAFLAQLAHESAELRYMEEIASGEAYEGRKNLGNTQPGDGKRFKGRGPIQLTGRANYKKYGDLLGLDLVGNPKQAAMPSVGFRVAGLYWKLSGLNQLADRKQFKAITKRINGGYNGLPSRVAYYERALSALADGSSNDQHITVSETTDEPVIEKPADEAKGATPSDKQNGKTAGTLPPGPAVEIKASEVPLWTKITSLAIPAGAGSIILGIVNFAKSIPPVGWVALSGIIVAAMIIGFLVWRERDQQAHERTKIVMTAGADKDKNNLRLI